MNQNKSRKLGALAALFGFGLAMAAPATAVQTTCTNRGALSVPYCDENRDFVADSPKDLKLFNNPSTLVFTYSPVEDPVVYENIFKPFTAYLSQCMRRPVAYYRAQSNAAEIEAMRSGRLHVGGFSTGSTNFAVNQAGAVPFAVKGSASGMQGYQLIVIVKKDKAYSHLADLKGKKVAHVQASSHSGNLAPRALFPALGLTADRDYNVLYSGSHENSIIGVASGDYDAAPVASTVFHRMVARGLIQQDSFRILWRSGTFPSTSFAHAHDLEPSLREAMVKCFYEYRFSPSLQKAFDGADRFVPITYQKDWAIVRSVAENSGEKRGEAAPEKPKQ